MLDADEVLRSHYDELAAGLTDPDLEAWIAEEEVDRTANELRPFLDELIEEFAHARRELGFFFEQSRPDLTFEQLWSSGVAKVIGRRDVYEAAFDHLAGQHVGHLLGSPYALRPAPTIGGREDVAREIDRSQHRVAALEAQVEQAELALARVTEPRGVGAGVAVLAYFATVGSVLPLGLLLALDGLPGATGPLVLVGFATGFGALIGYVVWQVRHLT